ncbi:hypothetical protein [Lysinibacillus piscis]|uniref:Membrane protein YuaF n=1 Tax=Lysinibacillus piscis TaxID=2518931 RepID=A0ABQ5NFD1_9BACI|nr:hypothetical protein [Lysinibacillus sp. KH24]GLC87103.1 putative membrane protein YuaF [Lysinibacillus sp. KH24]
MTFFGYTLEQLFLVTLIIAGLATILLMFFGDVVEGIGEGLPIFNPSVILSFITLMSAAGFILEKLSLFSSGWNIAVAAMIGAILSALFYLFVLVPLRSADVSLAYTEESLGGQLGKVIVPIPQDGFGEVVIETASGMIAKRATGFDNEAIDYDVTVLIVEVKEGTLFVKSYDKKFI